MKKITKTLFNLTPEQEQTSISMYGKVIKCLIAPYHNIQNIPLEPNDEVYVYPERDLSIQQRKEMVSIMSSSKKNEIYFVTSDLFMIMDMIDCCCRILTPDGKIEELSEKTFSANPHTIIYNVLQDDKHVDKYKSDANDYRNKINVVIDAVNKKKMTQVEYDKNKAFIDLIGEEIIRNKLKSMLREVKIIREEFKKENYTGIVDFTPEEIEFIKNRKFFKENKTIKDCRASYEEYVLDSDERISVYNQLINLQKGMSEYEEDLENNIKGKKEAELGVQMRHKFDYWLSEQNENSKIQDILKNENKK